MSTRGTYTITAKTDMEKTTTKHFYIHCDNYEEGAAFKFRQLVEFEGRGSAFERFIRALPDSEFTSHPDHHGDTEYHYDINGDTWEIVAYKIERNWEKPVDDFKKAIFTGSIADFINKFENADWYDEKPSLSIMHRGQPTTRKTLEKIYTQKLEKALLWTARGHIGNASGTAKEAYKIHETLNPDKIIPQELVFLAEIYVKAYKWENKNAQDYIDRCYKDN